MNAKLAHEKATKVSRNLIISRIQIGIETKQRINEINKKQVEAGYSYAKCKIEEAVKRGNFSVTLEISTSSFDCPRKLNIAKKIAKKLELSGFKARAYHDTIGTGVDEWEDRYCINVSW